MSKEFDSTFVPWSHRRRHPKWVPHALPEGRNCDERPVWESPIFNYSGLIGEVFEKQRDAVLKYLAGGVVKATEIMDTLLERRFMDTYQNWALVNAYGRNHECNLSPQGLHCEVAQDLEQDEETFSKVHFKVLQQEDGRWMALSRDHYERNLIFQGLHRDVFKDWTEDEATFRELNIKSCAPKGWKLGGNESRRILGVGRRKGNGPLPPTQRRDDKFAAVDTNFDAQTALQKDEIRNISNAKSHSALEDGRQGSQNTPSADKPTGAHYLQLTLILTEIKLCSDEGNQEQACSMPSAGDSATDVQQSQPQCFPAASSNSKLRQTTLDGWIKNGQPKHDTRPLAVRLMGLKGSEGEVTIALQSRRTDDDVD